MVELITTVNEWAWGPAMLVLLLGTGAYLSLGLRMMTVRRIPAALRLLLGGRRGVGGGGNGLRDCLGLCGPVD